MTSITNYVIIGRMDESNVTTWEEKVLLYKDQLLMLAERQLHPVLRQRLSPEDLVQEVFAHVYARRSFFEEEPEVPFFFKLRRIFFQTLKDLERKHLRSACRDAYKDTPLMDGEPTFMGGVRAEAIPEESAGPQTIVARKDKYHLLQRVLQELNENDRHIIEMRHFDELSNDQCAKLLNRSPKAASIRYIRALERLQNHLLKFTEFNP